MLKRIGYDIDGCVVDSYPWFTMYLQNYYTWSGRLNKCTPDGHEMFHYEEPDNFDGDWELFSKRIEAGIAKCHEYMHPVQGAIEAIEKISRITCQMPVFITCRGKDTIVPFRKWIKRYSPSIEYSMYRVDEHTEKRKVIEDLMLTHFVEDRYCTANDIAPALSKVYLINKIYNDRLCKPNVQRMCDWSTISFDYLEVA